MNRHIAGVLVFSFALVVAAASPGNAAMVFTVDMNQDGVADGNWPLAVGDTVTVDIFVSNIPEPGLGAMGFLLTYDETVLAVTSAEVDADNFPSGGSPVVGIDNGTGEVEIIGNRIPTGPEDPTGISGDDIRLATVTLQRIDVGDSPLHLSDRAAAEDDFVLFTLDPPPFEVLDDEIGDFAPSVTIRDPLAGDVNGDGIVDLADAILTLQTLSATGGGVAHRTGDSSGDDAVGLEEGIWVLQKAAGLR